MTSPTIYEMWRLITIFATACHWSLYSARYLQSTPSNPISSRPILILPSQLCLGFYIVSFLQVFQPKSCMHFSFLLSMPVICPSHPILLELLSLIMSGKEYRPRVSHYAIFSNLLLLSHSFKHSSQSTVLRHPWLCPSIKVKDQDSHSYKTTGKITIYVLK